MNIWKLLSSLTDLEVVWMHGEKGTGPAQFYIPHSVAVDSFERVSFDVNLACQYTAKFK